MSGHTRHLKASHQTVSLFFLSLLNTKGGIGLLIGWHCAVSNARGRIFPSTIYCGRLIYELFQAAAIMCSEGGGLGITTTRVCSARLQDEM